MDDPRTTKNLKGYLNFLCLYGRLEVGLEDDFVVHGVLLVPFGDHRVDAEGEGDVVRGSVSHQLELPIRWDEADRALALELAQLHTLMECTVIDCYASLRGTAT